MTTHFDKQAAPLPAGLMERLFSGGAGLIGKGIDRAAPALAKGVRSVAGHGGGGVLGELKLLGSDLKSSLLGKSRPVGQQFAAGNQGLLHAVAEKPQRLLHAPAAYYGGEIASAPFSGDSTMQDKRENYWGSVAAGAGDQQASGHNRLMDWLLTPGRALRARFDSSVPNKLQGDESFTNMKSKPGTFKPGEGATNEAQLGVMQHSLSQYQRAQQALATQAERAKEDYYQKARRGAAPLDEASEDAQKKYQGAFPHTPIPGTKPTLGAPGFSQILGHAVAQQGGKPSSAITTPPQRVAKVQGPPSPEELEAIYERYRR